MAYVKTTWETGDVITAAKLNNIEDGIAAIKGVLSIHVIDSDNGATMSATWQEIADAMDNSMPVFVFSQSERVISYIGYAANYDSDNNIYVFTVYDIGAQSLTEYKCPTADDFPYFSFND